MPKPRTPEKPRVRHRPSAALRLAFRDAGLLLDVVYGTRKSGPTVWYVAQKGGGPLGSYVPATGYVRARHLWLPCPSGDEALAVFKSVRDKP